jgi:hypothetical protein
MPLEQALDVEFRLGQASLRDPELGRNVRRFVDGAGRHGS